MTDTETADRRRGASVADRIRILIVDDHALFRAGIVNVLAHEKDFEVVGEAADGRSAIEASNALSPNIVLMDLSLPQPGGKPSLAVVTVKVVSLYVSPSSCKPSPARCRLKDDSVPLTCPCGLRRASTTSSTEGRSSMGTTSTAPSWPRAVRSSAEHSNSARCSPGRWSRARRRSRFTWTSSAGPTAGPWLVSS